MYFTDEMFNVNLIKNELMKDYEIAEKGIKITSSKFKKALVAWCKFNGHLMNPPEQVDKSGRNIGKDISNKTVEQIFIKNESLKNSNHLY